MATEDGLVGCKAEGEGEGEGEGVLVPEEAGEGLACAVAAASLAFATSETAPGLPAPVNDLAANTTDNARTAHSAIQTQGCLRDQKAWRGELDMRNSLFRMAGTKRGARLGGSHASS